MLGLNPFMEIPDYNSNMPVDYRSLITYHKSMAYKYKGLYFEQKSIIEHYESLFGVCSRKENEDLERDESKQSKLRKPKIIEKPKKPPTPQLIYYRKYKLEHPEQESLNDIEIAQLYSKAPEDEQRKCRTESKRLKDEYFKDMKEFLEEKERNESEQKSMKSLGFADEDEKDESQDDKKQAGGDKEKGKKEKPKTEDFNPKGDEEDEDRNEFKK